MPELAAESTFLAPSGIGFISLTALYRMKSLHISLPTIFASAVLLAGCLVPEKFSAKIDVQPDAGYTFQYSGTVIHALAAMQIKSSGSISEKDQAALKTEAERIARDKEVRKAVYKGDGRFELEIESTRKAGQPLRMLDIFSVRTDKDGVMTITSSELKEKDKSELAQIGIIINGTLEIKVPRNVEIISHNATSTPTFGFGSYSWKIGRIDQRPMMKLKIKSPS